MFSSSPESQGRAHATKRAPYSFYATLELRLPIWVTLQTLWIFEHRGASKIDDRQKVMRYVFISGIPASGKSYLAQKVAKITGALHFKVDDWREEFRVDKHADWVDFFWNKNESDYWDKTGCEKHWQNIVKQSEALWPDIVKKIKEVVKSGKPAIFEGVNILPHLAKQDLNFEGIVLLGESIEIIFERNKEDPRWGKTETLQLKEAEVFYNCEGKRYQAEAEKQGYKAFSDIKLAEAELVKLLNK